MASELIPDAAGFVWLTLVAIVGIWWLQRRGKGRSKGQHNFRSIPLERKQINLLGNKDCRF
jgi:hypothetical protein